MSKQQVFGSDNTTSELGETVELPARSRGQATMRGLAGKCPCCGEGKIFSSWLVVADECENCGEELFHHRADDLPAYLNIFIVGHVVVGSMLAIYTLGYFEMWTMVALTSFIAVAAAMAGLQPIKGGVVGLQWALYMHGFGGEDNLD